MGRWRGAIGETLGISGALAKVRSELHTLEIIRVFKKRPIPEALLPTIWREPKPYRRSRTRQASRARAWVAMEFTMTKS